MQCRKEDAEMPRQHNNNAGGFLTECKEAPCMYQGEGEKGEFQENSSGFELALMDILKGFLVME